MQPPLGGAAAAPEAGGKARGQAPLKRRWPERAFAHRVACSSAPQLLDHPSTYDDIDRRTALTTPPDMPRVSTCRGSLRQ